MRNFSVIFFEFGLVVQEEMPLKGISYLELWQPFCLSEWSHLCNCGRWHYEEQFCKLVVQEWLIKGFLIWSSGGSLQWSGTIYAILEEGIMGTIL